MNFKILPLRTRTKKMTSKKEPSTFYVKKTVKLTV